MVSSRSAMLDEDVDDGARKDGEALLDRGVLVLVIVMEGGGEETGVKYSGRRF